VSADLLYSKASLWRPKKYAPSGWTQHAPFGFWIIDALRPRTLVELGTYYGFSYLAFLQAIKELKVACSCFAIDTWQGDEHAGFYQDSVLQQLRQEHDPSYADFSELIQCTFDEALHRFETDSIDLLHIDGRHFYEDVKHDFETWRPKLSPHSVVLFHDTQVHEREFGVHHLWEELSPQFPSFEFTHGHGLGILGVGQDLPNGIRELFSAHDDPHRAALVRDLYQRLGEAVAQEGEQAATVSALRGESQQLRQEIDLLTRQTGGLGEVGSRLDSVQAENQQLRVAIEQLRNGLQAADGTRLRLEGELRKIQNNAEFAARSRPRNWRITNALRTFVKPFRMLQALRQIVRYRTTDRQKRIVLASGLFDAQSYLSQYPDVQRAGVNPVDHYLLSGAAEGRNPNPLFDTAWYLSNYADVAEKGENPFVHFLCWGWREGRDPNPFFDTDWYLNRYTDVAAENVNPLLHYLRFGASEGRDPGPNFDTNWYAQNPDVIRNRLNPLAYYLSYLRSSADFDKSIVRPHNPLVGGFESHRTHT